MRSLAEIAEGAFRHPGLARAVRAGRLARVWGRVVGARAARHCEPDRVEDGVLFIRTGNPAWRTELRYHQQEILRRIAGLTPDLEIRELRFTRDFRAPAKQVWAPPPPAALPEELQRAIDTHFSSPGHREAAARMVAAALARRP